MFNISDELLKQGFTLVSSVAALMLGGVAVRRVIKKQGRDEVRDQRDAAKDQAESSYFDGAIEAITLDRDRWRHTAEEGWQRNSKLEAQNAVLKVQLKHIQSQMKLQRRLVQKYPDLDKYFESEPIPFETTNEAALDITLPIDPRDRRRP